ncbi:MAG: SDR family oxidoreductase [bacterium]
MKELKGKKAIITGASSGFGVDFANIFAEMGMDVIIVARRRERLEKTGKEIEEKYGVKSKVIAMDLAGIEAARKLCELVNEDEVEVLVNNAGYGIFGYAGEQDVKEVDSMIQLNVSTVAALTNIFLEKMINRDSGYILNVASFAGFSPMPLYAAYAATKAFVMNYSVSIHTELREKNSGVVVSAFCPGYTKTEFIDVARQKKSPFVRMVTGESFPAAKKAVKAMFRGKAVCMPGIINKTGALILKFMSRKAAAKLIYNAVKK